MPEASVLQIALDNPGVSDIDLSGASAKFLYTPVNTDCKSCSRGGAGHDALERIQRRYPDEIVIHADNDEATFVLESVSEEVSLADLEREFQLPTPREYEDRVRRGAAPRYRRDSRRIARSAAFVYRWNLIRDGLRRCTRRSDFVDGRDRCERVIRRVPSGPLSLRPVVSFERSRLETAT